MKKLIIISGPTASGKTAMSIDLARLLASKNIESAVVNFDSLLFYKELNIGTAKPTKDELESIEHHLIDISSIASPLNASDYISQAKEKIDELHSHGKIVFLVGGSAFYLRALIKGMYESNGATEELREEITKEFKTNGIEPFIDFLKSNDPKSLEKLHPNDHYRILRAVEHFKMTGSPISSQKDKMDQKNPYDFSENDHPDWDILHLYLDLPKDEHWKIIQKRSQKMFDEGLLDEVDLLLKSNFSGEERPLQSIGYKESIDYIRGNYSTLNECIERLNISTRQLAKSQRTFFNKITPKECFHPLKERALIFERVLAYITK